MKSFRSARKWYAFDVETTGEESEYALQPWSKRGQLRSFALAAYDIDEEHVDPKCKPLTVSDVSMESNAYSDEVPDSVDVSLHETLGVIAKRCASMPDKFGIVGWNVAFDAAWMIHAGYREEVMKIKWLDAMLLWKHMHRVPESSLAAYMRKSYSLKSAVEEFFPEHAGYEDGVEFDGPIEPLMRYNRMDAEFTLRLAQIFWNDLAIIPEQLRCALIESTCIPLVADAYINGIDIDLAAATNLQNKLDVDLVMKGQELTQDGVTEEMIASPKQLRELLYDKWDLPVSRYTPKGEPSTDKVAIHDLSAIDDRVRTIGDFRVIKNLRTKFVSNIVQSCEYNEEAVTHPTPIIAGTYTGRMTYASSIGKGKARRQTGFALHQMRRDPVFRRVCIPPEGYELIEWDAAGQEYRWMAIESGDETMLELCMPGEDPHAYMGASIANWDYRHLSTAAHAEEPDAKNARQMGKVGNLSCQYRIGYKSLHRTARVGYGMDISLSEARHIHDTYHRTYPGVKKYWRSKISEARTNGFARTIAGRRVVLDGDFTDPEHGWKLESTAVNFPIQGIGADQKYLAMMCLKPLFTKYGARFAWELHDGLFAVAPTKVAKLVALKGRDVLNNMPYEKAWGFTPPVPLPWDVSMGPSWGDIKKLED